MQNKIKNLIFCNLFFSFFFHFPSFCSLLLWQGFFYMTTFSTVDTNPFPITTTMTTTSATASSSMDNGSDIYYYHPITGMTVLLVEGLHHQPPPAPQQQQFEQWNTTTTTDPLSIYSVQHHQQQQSQPQQLIAPIYTRTAQPIFSYSNIASVGAATTHQQPHHNQQNSHQHQQNPIVNTAITTANTPMVPTSNDNVYLASNPATIITATNIQPQRQQPDFLIKQEGKCIALKHIQCGRIYFCLCRAITQQAKKKRKSHFKAVQEVFKKMCGTPMFLFYLLTLFSKE